MRPWERLRRVTKIEIMPGMGHDQVDAQYEENVELDEWHSDILNERIVARNRRISLTHETVNVHYDYPDDFKKLVSACEGDYLKAYNLYQALQKPVPKDWDVCNKDGEFDCDCC
jgi:hypothetical protein